MSAVTVDYAALGLDEEWGTDPITPDIRGMVTSTVISALRETEEYKAMEAEFIKDYLRSLSLEVTYKGAKRVLANAVEVANFYGELNEDRRKVYRVIKNGTAEQVANAKAFEAEIDSLKEGIIEWAQKYGINTQRQNAQTKFGKGFVALRHVEL